MTADRRFTYILTVLSLLLALFFFTNNEAEIVQGSETRNGDGYLNFTFLENGGYGSTAFRVTDGNVVIYIEAFPASSACKLKPNNVFDADIIIQETHGHGTHYDANSVYTVQSNSNATVVGNEGVIDDMTTKGVNASNLVEMDPSSGSKITTSIPKYGVNITAIGMPHTFISTTNVVTFLVEMPNGMKWFHGTCYSDPGTDKEASMRVHNELKNLDAMLLDFDHSFSKVETDFSPVVMCSHHDYSSTPYTATYWKEGYSVSNSRTLYHGDFFMYPPDYKVDLQFAGITPPSGYMDTEFKIKARYKYYADVAPTSAEIIFSNGSSYDMIPDGNDWKDSVTFSYTSTLPHGSNKDLFHIEFEVEGITYRIPEDGKRDGPPVEAYPILSDNTVTPQSGNDDEQYTFQIKYMDLDDDRPTSSYVYIDGSARLMQTQDITYSSGSIYTYVEKDISVDDHEYHFEFSDGENDVRFPESGEFQGPSVIRANYAPVLENGAATPSSGFRSTTVEFSINYRDSHGDTPAFARVIIDEVSWDMDPAGSNYMTGVKFTYDMKLGLGNHQYHFEFSDGEFEVRLPEEGDISGPIIENNEPVAMIDYPMDSTEFTTEESIGFDASSSYDQDDDDLNYTWMSNIDGIIGYGELLLTILSDGLHTITLTIDDGFGGIVEEDIEIQVIWYRPILSIDITMNPAQPSEGQSVEIRSVLENYGNGEATSVVLHLELDGESLATRSIPRIMAGGATDLKKDISASAGDHVLKAFVDGGAVEYLNFSVEERPAPVAIVGPAIEAEIGEEIQFNGANSTFSGGTPIFKWDFDDGTQEYGITITHTFSGPGKYNVTLTLIDDLEKISTAVIEVTVNEKIIEEEVVDDSGGEMNAGIIAAVSIFAVLFLIVISLVIMLLIKKKSKPVDTIPPVDTSQYSTNPEPIVVEGTISPGDGNIHPPT